jgi:pimeloyl-ACP methyl ester carboxylesterase
MANRNLVSHSVQKKPRFTYEDFYLFQKGLEEHKHVLFLHGAGSNHKMWRSHIHVLGKDFFCIAPDLPGHGKSNHLSWTTIEHIGDEIANLIRSRTEEKIFLVGFSLGGILALYLLENYPKLIERAVIDGASAYPVKGSGWLVLLLHMISPFLKSDVILNTFAKSMDLPEEEYPSFKKNVEEADRKSFKKCMIHANTYKLINKDFAASIPVLYASGEKESKAMHDSHIELSKYTNESQCVQYPGKGHAWMVFDFDTHTSMIQCWVDGHVKLPEKLRIIK